MIRIFKALVVLAVLVLIGVTIYAYLGDMEPERREVREPVELNVGQ